MSLQPTLVPPVPETTARVARTAFPKGTLFVRMRDALSALYDDALFAPLYSERGRPAEAPWRLALVSVMQFAEGLSDRQAAESVRSRIDWKYALSLDLDDPGFDFSVLSEFRTRLVEGGLERGLLDAMLTRFQEGGLLKARGKQRTDSTHVLSTARKLNRLETLAETVRAALNALASVAPKWLGGRLDAEWVDRYGRRVEEYRLPKGEDARKAYAAVVGRDGVALLDAVYAPGTPDALHELPAVDVLRRVWLHQFVVEHGVLRLRTARELPPAGLRVETPHDPEARYGHKRSTTWSGYKAHLTETCDDDAPHLVVHVSTTGATEPDIDAAWPVHEALNEKGLLPGEHYLDAGYVDADLLARAPTEYGVEVVGPVRPDVSWQATEGGYDASQFAVDWDRRRVTCPEGKENQSWGPRVDNRTRAAINVKFSRTDCRLCASRARCTRADGEARHLTLRPEGEHEALLSARAAQKTPEWKGRYDRRAGIEGTVSQGVRRCGLRQARYRGLAKTHLQHVLTASAMNVVRAVRWIDGEPLARTRVSPLVALAT